MRSARLASLFAAALFTTLCASKEGHATGAVVPHSTAKPTAELDVRVAVAGGTRWSQVTVSSTRVMWLVPARPGAALDWASEGWLDALDEATNVRVLRPAGPPPCPMPGGPQPAKAWAQKSSLHMPAEAMIHTSEGDVRAHAAARGFVVSPSVAASLTATFAAGHRIVSFEIDATSGVTSTPTLRVSDDGAPMFPLALTGSDSVATKVNAFAITSGAATVPGAAEIEDAKVMWTLGGSSYEAHRLDKVTASGNPFLRESSSRSVLFDGIAVGSINVPSIASIYFSKTSSTSANACLATAKSAAVKSGVVRRACASGALARIPGGATCTPGTGEIDPVELTCAGNDDLALALADKAPGEVFVTRFAGLITKGALGQDLALSSKAASRSSVVQASEYGTCDATSAPPPPPPLASDPQAELPPESGGSGYVASDGCGSSTSSSSSTGTVVYYEESGDDSGCGGDTSSSSSSSDDSEGWDSEDDEDDDSGWDSSDDDSSSDSDGWDSDDSSSSSESCGGSSSSSSSSTSSSSGDDGWDSSSSSESCGGSSSSSSSGDDGWDTSGMRTRSQELNPEGKTGDGKKVLKKKHHKKAKKKGQKQGQLKTKPKSPVSRFAFLAVAFILPIRRLLRKKDEEAFKSEGERSPEPKE